MSPACASCGSQTNVAFRAQDLNQRITDAVFTYYRCPACSLIFLSPIPENLGDYYNSQYDVYDKPATTAELAARAEEERDRIDLVKRFVSGGRLLDIGPAYGAFAYLAKHSGFEVDALEMDEGCCQYLTHVVGVRAVHSMDPQATLASAGRYSAITLWHVVEHLSDPWGALATAAEHLEPGGILAIIAPSPDALHLRVFRQYWSRLEAPRHVALIPATLLVERLQATDLRCIYRTTVTRDSFLLGSTGIIYQSLGHCIGAVIPGLARKPVACASSVSAGDTPMPPPDLPAGGSSSGRGRLVSGAWWGVRMALLPLAGLLSRLSYIEGWGAAYTLVFQKPLGAA